MLGIPNSSQNVKSIFKGFFDKRSFINREMKDNEGLLKVFGYPSCSTHSDNEGLKVFPYIGYIYKKKDESSGIPPSIPCVKPSDLQNVSGRHSCVFDIKINCLKRKTQSLKVRTPNLQVSSCYPSGFVKSVTELFSMEVL